MSVPSLRQKQINEVLDYHRLINRTVFDRNVKSVFASNQSKAEPRRTDIETEANLRERVDKIKNILQQIIQFTSYGETTIDPTTGGESKEGTMEGRTNDTSATFLKSRSDTSLASLLSEYNGICGLYDLKNRAHVFSESESNALTGIVRELKEPLIATIGTLMANKGKNKSYFQYYRVIKTVMDNIDSAPPFIKIQPSLLTEPYFIPDPSKVKVIDAPLWKHMIESRDAAISKLDEYERIPVSSVTEKRAKQKAVETLTRVVERIDKLIESNDKALRNRTSDYAIAFQNYTSFSELASPSTPAPIRKHYEAIKKLFKSSEEDPYDLGPMVTLWREPSEPDELGEKFGEFSEKHGIAIWTSDILQRITQDELEKLEYSLNTNIQSAYKEINEGKRSGMPIDELKSKYDVFRSLNTSLDNVVNELENRQGKPPPGPIYPSPIYPNPRSTKEIPDEKKFIALNKRIEEIKQSLVTEMGLDKRRSLKAESSKLKKERDAFIQKKEDTTKGLSKLLRTSEGSVGYYSSSEEEPKDSSDDVATSSSDDLATQSDKRLAKINRERRAKLKRSQEKETKSREKRRDGRGKFADDSVLTPYLTKHLKPSKFNKPKPESESDNPDNTSEEEGGKKPRRKKKATKPLIDNKRDEDLWFM